MVALKNSSPIQWKPLNGKTLEQREMNSNNWKMLIQCKPLNMITLGQRLTDNIIRMITISGCTFYINSELELVNLIKFDHNNWMITLSVITLSGFHCTQISLYLHKALKSYLGLFNLDNLDPINRLIPLTKPIDPTICDAINQPIPLSVIPLSGAHCRNAMKSKLTLQLESSWNNHAT
jgi:hypothetical protein